MKPTHIEIPEIKLVGISVRTSYQNELDKMKGKIFPCVREYFHGALFNQISHRTKPGTTFCVYTDYESDHKGAYTYFIGEQVDSHKSSIPSNLVTLTIPAQSYAKFTNGPAPMPEVVVKPWDLICNMSSKDLGGKRRYQADFEIYDERASDHQNIILDIFVGLI